jgi:hypothetical protein
MSKSKGLDEHWRSQNAQKCIDNFEYPIPMFTKFNLSSFLKAYQKAYPANLNEYAFLAKISVADWKFCAKRFRCTSWHHYGPTAQRTGFWDLWALSDEILSKCRTKDGRYQYQLLVNYISSSKAQTRLHTNDLYQKKKIRLCIIKFLGTAGIIYAPCLIQEHWGKSRKQDIVYFDYVQIKEYHKCDSPTMLSTEDIQKLEGFAITNTFRRFDETTFTKFSTFHKSSFTKLFKYAETHNLTISTVEEDPRPKLVYKGPPKP